MRCATQISLLYRKVKRCSIHIYIFFKSTLLCLFELDPTYTSYGGRMGLCPEAYQGMQSVSRSQLVAGRPGSSEVPRNPLTRWDVSSIPANGIFLTKKTKKQNKNAQRVEND